MLDQCRRKAGRCMGVAKHAVIHALADGGEDWLRRSKIHIRHPERQDLATGPAIPFLGARGLSAGAVCKRRIWLGCGTCHA